MKYSVHDYAKALDAALAEAGTLTPAKSETIGKNFLAIVRRNGDEGRLKKILEEAGRLSRGKQGTREITVVSARALAKPQEKLLQQFVKPSDAVRYEIDPDVIAGIKIIVDDEMQFDGTMKAKLDNIFP